MDMERNIQEVRSRMGLVDEQSASLMLMVLCDDNLDLHQLERQTDNEMLESKIKVVSNIAGTVSRGDIAAASRCFRGSVYTEGEAISFTNATLYDICAEIMYDKYPVLLLENCSLKFLCERVHPQSDDDTPLNKKNRNETHVIHVTEMHYDIVVKRLSGAIANGNYSMTLLHPVLKSPVALRKLNQELQEVKLKNVGLEDEKGNMFKYRTDRGKYLLQWATEAHNTGLIDIIYMDYIFSEREVNKGLLTAVSAGNVEAMEFIFRQYDSEISLNCLRTAFSLAVDKYRADVVNVLVERESQISDLSFERKKKLFHCSAREGDGRICGSVLDHVFRNSAIGGRVLMVLLRNPSSNFRSICNQLLHVASASGNELLAEFVIPYSDVNNRDEESRTPLMNAALKCHKEMFDLLVANGADVTLTNQSGDSALHLACWTADYDFLEHILTLFDINSLGESGWTPIMNAAASGNEPAFRVLVSKGADLTLTDDSGDSVFHKACDGGDMLIVKYLLPSFDVNQRGGNGHTPLMKAVCRSNNEIYNLLVSHNADVSLIDNDRDTILHLASEVGNLEIVQRCLPSSDINCLNKHGWTPLMAALVFGETQVAEYLLNEGADTTLVDEVGDDVVTLAYRGGCSEIIQQLDDTQDEGKKTDKWTEDMTYLVCGYSEPLLCCKHDDPRLFQKDGFGDSLLHLACRGGKIRYVQHLLPCYDINERGRYDWTPVMMAARCGHLDVFEYLVSQQADLSLVSDTGEDVLTLACRGKNVHIIRELLSKNEFKDRDVKSC